MLPLNFPHTSKSQKLKIIGQNQQPPHPVLDPKHNQYNENVRRMRELLNKLSKNNFNLIEHTLLHKFKYTAQLLKQLCKMVFQKATTEQHFSELYLDLCESLFKRFNDKDNVEMNFKKLLLRKCQKEFYKQVQQANQQAVSTTIVSQTHIDQGEQEYRRRLRSFGNIRLIGDLFTRSYVSDKIVMSCLDQMYSEGVSPSNAAEVQNSTIQQMIIFVSKVGQYVMTD